MGDLFSGPLTAFDVIVMAVIVVSAVMSLGRGLVREASSILAFLAGGVVAYMAVVFFRDGARAIIPDAWPPIAADATLVVVGFLVAYALAAYIGAQLARLIHSAPEIGVLDRVAGAIFGAARGGLIVILFVLLMQEVIPRDATPQFIANGRLFPYAEGAADWIRANVPGMVDQARDAIPPIEDTSDGSNI